MYRARDATGAVAENIHILGEVAYADIQSYYAGASFFVFPSYLETFGIPLLEAMAKNYGLLHWHQRSLFYRSMIMDIVERQGFDVSRRLVAAARLISAFKLTTWDQGPKSAFACQSVLDFGVNAHVMLVLFDGIPSQLEAKTYVTLHIFRGLVV